MPVYLLHGFRWPRDGFTGIRVHAIVHNLEDCSVEYIQNENSRTDLLNSFRKIYPEQMKWLENAKTGQTLEFLEQYDPEDEFGDHVVSQPYAFVGDRVVVLGDGSKKQLERQTQQDEKGKGTVSTEQSKATASSSAHKGQASKSSSSLTLPAHLVKPSSPDTKPNPMVTSSNALSVNVEEVMSSGPAVTPQAWEALAELRDKIAEGQKIGWWVVYNGDPERQYEDDEDDEGGDDEELDVDAEEQEAEAEGSQTPKAAEKGKGISPTSSPSKDKALPSLPISSTATRTSQTSGMRYPELLENQQNTKPRQPKSQPSTASASAVGTEPNLSSPTATRPKTPKGREPPPVFAPPIPIPPSAATSKGGTPGSGGGTGSASTSTASTISGAAVTTPGSVSHPNQKKDNIPEPSKAKEVARKEGLRKKFFGKKEKS